MSGDPSLPRDLRTLIDKENVYVSIATIWEIAIKASLGRLDLNLTLDELSDEIIGNQFIIQSISFEDLKVLKELPFHHRDPFDRMLLSQAIANKFILISRDVSFKMYDVDVLW